MTKPIAYNYRAAEDRIAELTKENEQLKKRVAELEQCQNTELDQEKRTIQELLKKWDYKLP